MELRPLLQLHLAYWKSTSTTDRQDQKDTTKKNVAYNPNTIEKQLQFLEAASHRGGSMKDSRIQRICQDERVPQVTGLKVSRDEV